MISPIAFCIGISISRSQFPINNSKMNRMPKHLFFGNETSPDHSGCSCQNACSVSISIVGSRLFQCLIAWHMPATRQTTLLTPEFKIGISLVLLFWYCCLQDDESLQIHLEHRPFFAHQQNLPLRIFKSMISWAGSISAKSPDSETFQVNSLRNVWGRCNVASVIGIPV